MLLVKYDQPNLTKELPIILKYNRRLTLRIQPEQKSIIESNFDVLYVILLIEFDTYADFDNFKEDEERKKSYT